MKSLKSKLEEYASQIPLLDFNSSKYKLNLVKLKFAKFLSLWKSENTRPDHLLDKNKRDASLFANMTLYGNQVGEVKYDDGTRYTGTR